MNLLQLTNKIKEAADLHPLVNQVANGSIYEALNTGDVRYPISVVFSQSVVKEVRTIRYKYVLYFVDRLVGDNALEIQTTAISVIQQIINTLGNNVENISIVDGYSIQPFTEKFADECAGAFVQFDIVSENVLGNCSYDEGGDQPILDSYVRKDEVKQTVIEGETLPISSGAVFTALQGILVDVAAVDVSYDNTTSGLTSTDVQGAIDEVKIAIDTIPLSIRHDQTRDKNGNPDFLHVTQAEKDAFIKTSEEFENMVANATGCTRDELVAARDAGELTPGSSYRITDYITTSAQANTSDGGHQFDVIVTAVSVSELSEIARACHHNGDTYFANAKLEAWELKYCLDNDTNRFAWADSVNGKGVIYYMKDEWGNECPYDFKNIQFVRKLTDGYLDEDNGVSIYVYTFTWFDENNVVKDLSMIGNELLNDEGYKSGIFNNTIKETTSYSVYFEINTPLFVLGDNVFLYHHSLDSGLFYGCFNNSFGVNCYSNTFGDTCQSNVFGAGCYSNVFGDNCKSNTFCAGCYSNVFGAGCYSNVFGYNCGYNIFGNVCFLNKFSNDCRSNTFGDNFYSNTFGNECVSNIFGDDCGYNTFGNVCSLNTLGYNCNSNTFGDNSRSNTFGNGCGSNIFGANCYSNTFGNSCSSNIFGNVCFLNKFYHGVSGTTPKNYIRYIVLEAGVSNNNFYSNLTTSSQFYLQRIKISGLENANTTDTIITLPTTNTKYEWLICYTSGGVLKQYCPND